MGKDKLLSALRVGGLVVVVVLIFMAIFTSLNTKIPNSEKVWYPEMTLGDMDAKNYYVIYSDVACPYCVAFENAMVEHHDELMEYLKEKDILIEVRVSDFLYEFGESNPIESRYGAVGAFCAKKEGKFWEYYDRAIAKVWNEYFKGSGKNAFSEFNKNGKDYWIKIGEEAGMSEEFSECVMKDTVLDEVMENAEKMAKQARGLPYFKFNSFISSGFDLSWDWDYVLEYFEAGLES